MWEEDNEAVETEQTETTEVAESTDAAQAPSDKHSGSTN
jgi:hypothetical protein